MTAAAPDQAKASAPVSALENHRVILMPSGRQGDVLEGTTVLEAARSLGVEIESICGGRQTCGKCLIALERGTFPKPGITSEDDHLTPPDVVEQDYARKHRLDLTQQRMSCAARVLGDVLITVPEESQARKQVIRKAAGELTIDVDPAVRLVYVEVAPAELGGPGDWERLQTALAEQWDLPEVGIDPVILPGLQKALRSGGWSATVTLWQEREVIRVEPGYIEGVYGLAVDVGSTTLAGHLCDLRTGAVLATETMMNPQVRFGEDLMSRVSYGMIEAQGVHRMHRAIIEALDALVARAAAAAEIEPGVITDLILVGNTVMHHLLLGIDPVELGGAPFALATQTAIDMKARDLGLKAVHPGGMVHILPCIAGHVGADNVAVLLTERDQFDDEVSLVVDIGTNAEILLGRQDRVLSASSPTGPAFEGAQITHGQRAAPGAIERVRLDIGDGSVRYKVIGDERWSDELETGEALRPTGICGSGIIEAVGELFATGLIEPNGRFGKEADRQHPHVRYQGRTAELVLARGDETATGQEIVVTQKDIRAIQLAKAALYAGVRLLMDRLDVAKVDRIKLAGAFGSYIDPLYALLIGLVPDCDPGQVMAVGNAAGDGARMALLNRQQRLVAQEAAETVEYVETAVEPMFQDYFVAAMALPHADDSFPHLEGIMADIATRVAGMSSTRPIV